MLDIIQFLGMKKDDPNFENFLKQLGVPEEKKIEHLIYLDYRAKGICFLFNKVTVVTSIFLYSEGVQDHKSFKGEMMPNALSFSQSKTEVRQKFSSLFQSGGGQIGMLGRKVKPWDKFKWNDAFITITYSDNLDGIELISISVS